MKKHIFALFLFLLSGAAFAQQKQGYIASLSSARTSDRCMASFESVCAEVESLALKSSCPGNWATCKINRKECTSSGFQYYVSGTLPNGGAVGGDNRFSSYNVSISRCDLKEEKTDTEKENKCDAKKGQVHGDGTASATVTGKENVDRFLGRIGKGPISLCQDGCVIKGSPSVAVCEESNCPFTLENVTYTGGQCKGNGTSLDAPQNPNPETPKPPKEETPKPKEPEEPLVCPISKNQCPGIVNGKRVCVPCGDSDGSPKPPKPGASDAAGSGNGQGTGNGNGGFGNGQGTGNGQGSGTGPGSGGGSGGGAGGGNGSGNGTGNGSGSGSGSGGGNGDGNGKGDGKGDKEEGEDGAGPSFGERPGLYEPKYKNGVKGVWDQKKGQLQNSGLGRLSKRLMPTVNSGNCPRWDIDLNFGRNMNFGTKNVAPPCTIWPILRAIVMVCALLLARRLVFGG